MADEETPEIVPESLQDESHVQHDAIQYIGTEDTFGVYADVAVVAHQDDIFSLYFYQLQLPTFVAGKDEGRVERARAKCVARIVLTPQRLVSLYSAMGKNLVRFKDKLDPKAQAQLEALLKQQESQ